MERPETDALTMFTFEEILDEIESKQASAKTQVDSWDRLKTVAIELAGNPASEKDPLPVDATWILEKVSIQGYRGIANNEPLVLVFDPTPGITVLHGLNGAGKSSISDAIEIALTGETPAKTGGTAGRAALWDPIHLARGAAIAQVEVVLSAKEYRLTLQAEIDSAGNVQTHKADLSGPGGVASIELDASWRQSLASHQPVFAYASLERRVQLSRDLAEYFEGLLALGGSFISLQEAIAGKAGESDQALARWQAARTRAMKDIAQIDADHGPQIAGPPLPAVEEPAVKDNMQEWLESSELLQLGTASSPLPRDTRQQLADAATNVAAAILTLEEARVTSEQGLAGSLDALFSEATNLSIETDVCPVCAEPRPGWLHTLKETVKANTKLAQFRRDVEAKVRILRALTESHLSPVLLVANSASPDDPIRDLSTSASTLAQAFTEAMATQSPSHYSVLSAATSLSEWLVSQEAQILIDEAVVRTDAIKQWQIARTGAVQSFLAVWQADGELAAESIDWKETTKRLGDLQKHLRAKRSTTLEGRASSRVEELLSDAELRLQSINVLSTKASMGLADREGNKVELGMLSAGQRNAVLLAPLLASVDGGPFGFLVLDDPVHAFDELRIDRLADTLSEIAESRRVIVMTHDDRLKEYLASRMEDCDTRLVSRSNTSGEVEVSDSSHFWQELLNDAVEMREFAIREAGSTGEITNALRGLCRMAIDNALRTFTLRNAVLRGRDASADLIDLDSVHITNERLERAATFWEGEPWENPVLRATQECQVHLPLWNQAIHGNQHLTDFSRDEIRDARKACKKLTMKS
ncbi:AAA family ATPase [Leucobacter celer]|uniref:AAA family ATPase n=1 Tax=Leucobacter celer TaxID=668625 RepID=UPI0009FA84FE|nr:AAA family ATPase [Leucobacter celer]